MTSRRSFLTSCAAIFVTVRTAEAQQAAKSRRLGHLNSGLAAQWASGGRLHYLRRAWLGGLAELGYDEQQNLAVEWRFAEGKVERLPELAADLVRVGVEAIVAAGPAAIEATKKATANIPIVAIDLESDPVGAGYARSLGRPGGNITGVFLDQAELSGKWLELLKQAVPRLSRVGVVWDSTTPLYQRQAVETAGKTLAINVHTFEVGRAGDLEAVFVAAGRDSVQGVVILSSPLLFRHGSDLATWAAARRLPTIALFRESAVAGCLMAYGPVLADAYRHVGVLAAKLLNGARPSDTPIERPARFEFVINMKTAKTLGLTIPPLLLLRADQVIE